MSNYCMIETAFDNLEECNKVINILLNDKLVSSCQVVDSKSHWNWNSNREFSVEYLLIMKTKKDLLKKVYEVIKSIHSYECFEFAVFELTSINQDYLNWIDKEVNNG